MGLFRRKSVADIRSDIKTLETQRAAELKRRELIQRQAKVRAEYRRVKYAEEYRAARESKKHLVSGARTVFQAAKGVYANLKEKEVTPAFKADFTNKGSMVSVPKGVSSPSSNVRTSFAVPRVSDNSKAFAVRFK